MGKNKNKQQQDNDTYELKSSVAKIKSSKLNRPIEKTCASNQLIANKNVDIESVQLNQNNNQATLSTFDNSAFVHYDKLRDHFDCFKKDVNGDITNIRNDFSDKLQTEINALSLKMDKFVPKELFIWACSAILLIGGIIYLLSYSELITNTNKNTENNRSIVDSIKSINNKLDIYKNEVDTKNIKLHQLYPAGSHQMTIKKEKNK